MKKKIEDLDLKAVPFRDLTKQVEKKFDMRSVMIRGTTYIRKEDVMEYLLEMAATEESDVRDRIEKAADNIGKMN